MQFKLSMVATFVTLALLQGDAYAADYCLELGGPMVVAKGFKPPKPGKCSVAKGAYFVAQTGTVTLSGCTNTAGDTLRVTYSTNSNGAFVVGRIDLPYPALTGGTHEYEYSSGGGTPVYSGSAIGASSAPCTMTYPIL